MWTFFDDIHSIAADVRRIADCFCGKPTSLVATHGEPTKETDMTTKAKSLALAKSPTKTGGKFAAGVPAGDQDTVTIGVLDQQGNPMVTDPAWTLTSVSGDDTVVHIHNVTGLVATEHFHKAGTVNVHHEVSFPDGTKLSLDDTVTVTGVPGSLTATHSAPVVVGP
jgi:hypothetical protein